MGSRVLADIEMNPIANQGPPCEVVFHCDVCGRSSDPIIITELDANGVYILPRWHLWLTTDCTGPDTAHSRISVDLTLVSDFYTPGKYRLNYPRDEGE